MPIYHKHHIIPKHMGGTDDPSNLVQVTIEQHANLHKQLWEDLGCEEDRIAWLCLSGQISNAEAILLAIKNANTGKKWTEEQIRVRSELYRGKNNPFYGKKHTSLTKETISSKNKKREYSNEYKESVRIRTLGHNNPFYGKTHSDEFKRKISSLHKGRKQTSEHKEKVMKSLMRNIQCTHCSKEFNLGNYAKHIRSLEKKGVTCF